VIIFVLSGLTIRALIFAHDAAQLRLLRRRGAAATGTAPGAAETAPERR
jgi:hypothetical protein